MTFIETRGTLAKLLATENLTVNHDRGAQTASFNTETRTLTLPVLSTDSESVYNLFIGHEVGHALQTPTDWRAQVIDGTPFDFINVIEDVRIEKFIQNKFPGLRRDFNGGYSELNAKDFFGIEGKDLNGFSLIDRLNLHFKLGSLAMVPFSEEEQMWVNAIDEADTYQKVCVTAKMLSDWINQKEEDKEEDNNTEKTDGEGNEQGEETPSESDTDKKDDSNGDDKKEEKESQGNDSAPVKSGGGVKGEDEEVETEEASGGQQGVDESKAQTQGQFDKALEEMVDKFGENIIYVTPPSDKRALEYIVPVTELRADFAANLLDISRPSTSNMVEFKIGELRDSFKSFLSSIKKDVSFMAQQFEMKKSAAAYARQSINKTGVLNTSRLHEYKLTDDIFLRQSTTPDGKNHGLVMMVDWSGSMHDHLLSTVKQLLVLVQYCRKVQIPFEVYTFTTTNRSGERIETAVDVDAVGTVFTGQANIIQVLTSSAKNRDIDTDMWNLWCQVARLRSWSSFIPASNYLDMGGTPLDSALFAVPAMIRRFRANNKAEKVSFVCLTDGESSPVAYRSNKRMAQAYHENVIVRSGSTATPLFQEHSYSRGTGFIAQWLQDSMKDVTVTNIFLGKITSASNYLFNNDFGSIKQSKANMKSKFRKDGSFTTREGTWPMISVVDPKCFGDSQSEIQVDDGAGKAQIRSALKKFLNSKTSSKVLLSNLIEQFS